jgi:GNAT superfamily N-acetyltransferase
MFPRLRIRLATTADARAIGVLVRRVTRLDVLPGQSATAAAYLLRSMTARAERDALSSGRRYHVAELDGRVVGVVATRDDRHVFRLFVSRRFQGRGIGRALLFRAIADCRRRSGTRKFTLNASANAVAAYRKMGFAVAGSHRKRGAGGVRATPMVYWAPSRGA